jgi:hypothetical protein
MYVQPKLISRQNQKMTQNHNWKKVPPAHACTASVCLLAHLNFEMRQQKIRASKILLARARKYLHPIEFTTSQRSFPAIWREKNGFSTKKSTCRKPLKSYQIILSKLNAITCLTITLKSSAALIEMFSSLNKYIMLCKPKLLGPS